MCRVVEEWRLLFNVSKTLQDGPSLNEIVRPVLKQMAEAFDQGGFLFGIGDLPISDRARWVRRG